MKWKRENASNPRKPRLQIPQIIHAQLPDVLIDFLERVMAKLNLQLFERRPRPHTRHGARMLP